jgi:hypothetical protein
MPQRRDGDRWSTGLVVGNGWRAGDADRALGGRFDPLTVYEHSALVCRVRHLPYPGARPKTAALQLGAVPLFQITGVKELQSLIFSCICSILYNKVRLEHVHPLLLQQKTYRPPFHIYF